MTTQDKNELETVAFKERVSGVAVLQVDVDTNGYVIAAVPSQRASSADRLI